MKLIIPIILYLISISLLYMTSMQGSYLVGSDIQSEFYIANRMYWHWDTSYPHLYNASISTALIAPWISKLFGIDLITVFKAVYPVLFSFVPVLLYYIYRQAISQWKAIIAVLFFVAVPVFFLELPQLPRQELAEVFLCLIILVMISKLQYKIAIILPCALLIVMIHYSIGLMTIAFLLAMLLVKTVALKWKWNLLQDSRISFEGLTATLGITVCLALYWGLAIANGLPLHAISNIFFVGVPQSVQSGYDPVTVQTVTGASDSITAAAVGLDIFDSGISVWGKTFRVIQWITQLLIIAGCIRLLFWNKQYKFSSEFAAGIAASAGLLILCITVFGFSGLLGMTRFYHISLIFLAPMFAIGLDYIKT